MKLLITENQLKTLISEYYDHSQVYVREKIVKGLKNAPGFLKGYMRDLPRFYIRDEQGEPLKDEMGNKIIFTRIPEIMYDWFHGKF